MGKLNGPDKILCASYGVIAVAALIGTQCALLRHLSEHHGNVVSSFLTDSVVNPASTFTVIDLLAVAIAGLVFIVAEGRRLRMKSWWVYVVLTFLIAISVALPAFLIARQFRVAEQRNAIQAL